MPNKEVEHQLQKYYRSLIVLSGKKHMTPSHHMSLHLPKCLREFGPVHGWWGFTFERYNGIIQQQISNNKLSQSNVILDFFYNNLHFQISWCLHLLKLSAKLPK